MRLVCIPAVVVGFAGFVCTVGCDIAAFQERTDRCNAAEKAALTHVLNLTQRSPENQKFWRTADDFLFGPGVLGVAKKTTPRGEASPPVAIDVETEIWCDGRDAVGVPVRLARLLTVKMHLVVDQWTVNECSISSERELTYWDPPKAWGDLMVKYFGIGLGAPIFGFFWIYSLGTNEKFSHFLRGLLALALSAVAIASPFFAGYYAYWLTGSVLAVAIGFVASLPLAAWVFRAMIATGLIPQRNKMG